LKKPAPKGRRRNLDDDEAADWDHTTRTIKPLTKAKPRVHKALEGVGEDEPVARPRAKAEAGAGSAQLKSAPAQKSIAVAPATAMRTPPIADFDRKKAKKIRSGQIEIEARIDLHGMRQDEAHTALRGFLFRAQGQGKRWVLVITGKGKAGLDDDADAPFDMTRNRDRGVLKRNVPRWLEEPDLRPLVVSYTTAAISHGGEGALYVHLRKKG
jgi:DNA-nicking Smr family endonuclease